jgi:hypothetical protein
MRRLNYRSLTLAAFSMVIFNSCEISQEGKYKLKKKESKNMNLADFTLSRPLEVGDRIELSGGYDYDPIYLRYPPSNSRRGTILQFIKGQSEEPAAVVKLDDKITGEKITGDIVVLELRHVGQTWQNPTPVHIELCDFMPEDQVWKDRRQGEWVEAAALAKRIEVSN